MGNLFEFFIKNSKFSIVLSIFTLIFGAMGLRRMNSESYPSVNFATATVTTVYDGASAKDIETKITRPIEEEIRTVSGLKDVRSISQPGLSNIYIRVDIDNVDVPKVMSDLQKAVDRATDLPADLRESPKFLEIRSEEFPVFEIAIVGSNQGRKRDWIADLLKEELEDNSLVKDVRLVGHAKRSFLIYLDRALMDKYYIGINEVLSKISGRNSNVPGGHLKEPLKQDLLRIEGKVKNASEIEEIVIRSNFSGQMVKLKDFAKVKDDSEEKKVLTRYNSAESTLLILSKKGGADTIKLVKGAEKTLEQFKKTFGKDYKFVVYNNEAIKVKKKLEILKLNAISGLILVIIFLFLFLPGKIGIVSSLSLPIAVFATLGIMPLFGMNLNSITILALVIALGMLVDNAVVISENFTRLRVEGKAIHQAAMESVNQLWVPITATAFTTIAAFLPMLVTTGVMGQFIKFIPIIVTISLLVSLVESFFLLPMRLVKVGKKITSQNSGPNWFNKFQQKFENLMDWCVRRRYIVFAIFTGILFGSLLLMLKGNKFILFPAEQTEVYIARYTSPTGTKVEATDMATEKLSQQVQAILGEHMTHLVARSGTSKVQLTDPKAKDGNNVGMLIIYVDEFTSNNVPHTEVLNKLRTIKSDLFSELTFEAMIKGPPVGNDIEGTFRSNSESEINLVIEQVVQELKKINGVYDLKTDDVVGDDEIFVQIDYAKADRLGLNVANIGSSIRSAVSGKAISNVTLNNKEVDLMVRLKEEDRTDLNSLEQVKIMDNRGNLVSINQFTTFKKQSGEAFIKRYDFKRAKTLTGSVDITKNTPVIVNRKMREIFERIQPEHPEVSLIFGGVAESTKESLTSLFDALILSLIGIFAILVLIFRSYIYPFIIMTTIPLGLFGFSVAFFFHNRPISFLSLIGIIGLGGIIVNSGIVLISFIQQLREEGKLPLHQILVSASGLRLKAVMVTSLTTISGLIPTAYGIGGSDSMLIPMTMAMAWGLTSGTILTLIWVPCFYAILEDVNNLIKRLWNNLFQKTVVSEQNELQG